MAHARSPLLYVFLAVPVAYLLALIGFPIVYNLLMSLQEVNARQHRRLLSRPFVGLDNYRQALADPAFRKVFVNSLRVRRRSTWSARSASGLLVALFFSQQFPGAHFLRGLLLASWMLPALVVGALWKWLFATEYGVVNYVARRACG